VVIVVVVVVVVVVQLLMLEGADDGPFGRLRQAAHGSIAARCGD